MRTKALYFCALHLKNMKFQFGLKTNTKAHLKQNTSYKIPKLHASKLIKTKENVEDIHRQELKMAPGGEEGQGQAREV